MSVNRPVSSEQSNAKEKRKFSPFLFSIVSQMTLDEFKKYTNFLELLKTAIKSNPDAAKPKMSLDDYIKKNYKKNVPNEKVWKSGGFRSLTLTNDFYGSKTDARILQKIYGLKACKVTLERLSCSAPETNRIHNDSDVEELLEGNDDDDIIEQIDLTKDVQSVNHNIDAPKRRLKYPRKNAPLNLPTTSGVAAYNATRIFVDQIPTATSTNEFNEEIGISSTESIIEVVNPQPNETEPVKSAKLIEIISDVLLFPPTPFRDEANKQQQPETTKVCKKRKIENVSLNRVELNQSLAPSTNPKILPKSQVQQRTSRVVYIDEESEELTLPQPIVNATSQNFSFAKPKPKIGPKSRMSLVNSTVNPPAVMSTQELLEELMSTNDPPVNQQELLKEPPQNEDIPKSNVVMHSIENSPEHQLPLQPEELLQNLMHETSTVPPVNESQNEGVSKPKLQAGKCELVASITELKGIFGPKTSEPSESRNRNLPKICTTVNVSNEMDVKRRSSLFNARPKKKFSPISKDWVTELPCQSCCVRTSPKNHEIHIDPAPVVNSENFYDESTELKNNAIESFDALNQRAREQFVKYVAETEASALSLKHFWYEFLKSEYDNDSSAAETQLHGNVDDDHRMEAQASPFEVEAQSQAIINPNQLEFEVQSQSVLRMNPLEVEVQQQQQPVLPVNQHDLDVQSQSVRLREGNLELVSAQDPLHVQPCDVLQVQIKEEKLSNENSSWSNDVEIIEVPPSEPIEILTDSTQELLDNLQEIGQNSEEQLIEPFVMPLQPVESSSSKAKSLGPSKSKGFVTSLPKVTSKKRNYPQLEIVVEAAQKIPPIILPMHDFSQQRDTPPSNENYEIEECTMTESQHQRYELLNNENTMFLSSQLENYALNTGKTADPKSAVAPISHTQPMTLKRLSTDALNCEPNKRQRCSQIIKRELNWKIIDIKSIAFKPMPNNIFHLELQLRNSCDTFHVHDQPSIKRLLHLSDNEWKHVVKILTALNGHQYDGYTTAVAPRKLNLPSRVMDCFVQSIPLFVRTNIQFKDFMGHCVEASEQQPLVNKCVSAAIDPTILKKMEELKRNLCKK